MAKYRKKALLVDPVQWFKNGDHHEDGSVIIDLREVGQHSFLSEGKVVRHFRRPDVHDGEVCSKCKKLMCMHGWIDTLESGHIVCPGDWIAKGVQGEFYPIKPDIFEMTYDLI